jgi:hypothetical protein
MGSRLGSPNKNKNFLLNRLKDMYGDDFHPIMRMAESAVQLQAIADDEQDVQAYKAALDGWDKIANYTEPKLKSVEVTGKDGEDLIPNNITVKYE